MAVAWVQCLHRAAWPGRSAVTEPGHTYTQGSQGDEKTETAAFSENLTKSPSARPALVLG